MRRPLRVIAGIVALALTASACGGGEDRLTVYSGRTENLIGPLLEQFTDETGVEVDVRYGQSADLALLISEEGDRTPADVFISQSPGAVGLLAEEGRLATLESTVLDLVEPEDQATDGTWVGLSGRVRVLVYNTELVDPDGLPESVLDLTADEYEGDVAVAPENGSFQDFVTAMRSELGDDDTTAWLEAMAANGAPGYANNTAIVEAVQRGEVSMGLVNHYYNLRALAEDAASPTDNHAFGPRDIGSLRIVTAASVIQGSDRADEAEQLLAFLLSESAQEFFSAETLEYPLAAGVGPAEGVPPIAGLPVGSINVAELAGGLARTLELISESGIGS